MLVRPWNRLGASGALLLLSVMAVAAHGANPGALRIIPPKVWFFISDPKGLAYGERVGNYISMSLNSYNRKLAADEDTVDLAVDMKAIVCPVDQLPDKIEKTVKEAWLTESEKRKGRRAVFLVCSGRVHEPDKKENRALEGEPYRFQVDLKVEAESCSLVPGRTGVRKRRRWRRKFELTYITPRQIDVAPGQQPETDRRAVQRACEKFAKKFFEYRDDWMKIKRKRK